jgi:multiple antibiotic resistance protein
MKKKHGTLFICRLFQLNPIGTVPIFVGLTQDDDKKNAPISLWSAVNVL